MYSSLVIINAYTSYRVESALKNKISKKNYILNKRAEPYSCLKKWILYAQKSIEKNHDNILLK